MQYLDVLSRFRHARENCIEGTESGRHYIRGTFDDSRLAKDQELSCLADMLSLSDYNMPSFLRELKDKLIFIYTLGIDSVPTISTLTENCAKMKVLLKDLRAYNKVFVRDYETFLFEILTQLKIRLRQSRPIAKAADIQKRRERHLQYQINSIPWIRDSGYQYNDEKTGLIKMESGKNVPEYLNMLFKA